MKTPTDIFVEEMAAQTKELLSKLSQEQLELLRTIIERFIQGQKA